MMASVNKFFGIGNIGKIETRYSSSGDAITNFSIACNESYKDKNGEKVDKTEWISCVAYRKLAEIMKDYCQKGMQIYVSGKLSTRKYTDKKGIERYVTEVIVDEMKMIGSKNSSSSERQPSNQATSKSSNGFEDMSDDVPF